jgi:hypothetical protein
LQGAGVGGGVRRPVVEPGNFGAGFGEGEDGVFVVVVDGPAEAAFGGRHGLLGCEVELRAVFRWELWLDEVDCLFGHGSRRCASCGTRLLLLLICEVRLNMRINK